MLKITTISQASTAALKLEGKLIEPWVAELLHTCSPWLEQRPQLRLDLAAVTFMDTAGAQALRGLIRRGVVIGPCSAFVAELLKSDNAS